MSLPRRLILYPARACGVALALYLLWPTAPDDRPYHLIEPGLYLGSAVPTPPPGAQTFDLRLD